MPDAATQLDPETQRHERAAPRPQAGEIRQWPRRPAPQLRLQSTAYQRQQRAPFRYPKLSGRDGRAPRGGS
jgi:hypothetical protein